jgi:hypothetical protein
MAGTFSKDMQEHAVPKVRTCTLVNISDQQFVQYRTYRAFVIEPRNGKPYSKLTISPAVAWMDMGDRRKMEIPITADDIAADLEKSVNSDIPKLNNGTVSFAGVFVADGDEPTKHELAQAEERLRIMYLGLVEMADMEWDRTHNSMTISDDFRRAARYLGLTKDWLYEQRQMVECPVCTEKLRPGAAVCKSCGAILDAKKAAEYGIGAPEVEKPAKSRRATAAE